MTPDATIRWYYHLRNTFGAPAMNLVDSTGRVYADSCADCGGRTRHCRDSGAWVCGHCGQLWSYIDRHIFKGEVQKSIRTDTFEYRHAKWIDVGTQLHHFINDPLWKWDARVYVAHAMGFSVRQLVAEGPKFFPARKASWAQTAVFRRIGAARGEFFGRLKNVGIQCS